MSTNCIRCVVNKRTGFDLLCDYCRRIEQHSVPDQGPEQITVPAPETSSRDSLASVSLVEVEELRAAVRAARAFMDYLRANVGFSDEWPVELKVAEDSIEPIKTLLNNFERTVYAVKLPPNESETVVETQQRDTPCR